MKIWPQKCSDLATLNFDETFNDAVGESASDSKEIIIVGDFNINFVKASERKEFKELIRLYGFSQIIKRAIRSVFLKIHQR